MRHLNRVFNLLAFLGKSFLAIVGISLAGKIMIAPSYAEEIKVPIKKAVIVGAMNNQLQGMKVNIDTYGSRKKNSWYHNNSYILDPNGKRHSLNLPEITVTLKNKLTGKTTRLWRVYVNDFESTNMSVKADGSQLVFEAFFESQGEEIKVKCINRFGKKCVNIERDGEVNHAKVKAELIPEVYKNSITFKKNPTVDFTANIRIKGACSKLGDLCNKVTNYRSKIKKEVKRQLAKALNGRREQVANAIKKAIQPHLKNIPMANQMTLKSIKSSGSNYILTIVVPDQIDKNTVAIKKFTATKKTATEKCPATVTFAATIHTKLATSGHVWLRYENGKTSKKHQWSNGKGKTTTSNLSRQWNKSDSKMHKGWSQMIVTWKNKKGKTFTKKSDKAHFSRACKKPSPSRMKIGG